VLLIKYVQPVNERQAGEIQFFVRQVAQPKKGDKALVGNSAHAGALCPRDINPSLVH
jgi:hypothetical protein